MGGGRSASPVRCPDRTGALERQLARVHDAVGVWGSLDGPESLQLSAQLPAEEALKLDADAMTVLHGLAQLLRPGDGPFGDLRQ